MIRRDECSLRALFQLTEYIARLLCVANHRVCLPQLGQPQCVSPGYRDSALKLSQTFALPSGEEVGPPECSQRPIIAGIELHGRLGVGDGLIVAPGAQKRRHAIHSVSQTVQLLCPTLQCDCIVEASEPGAQTSVIIVSVSSARAQLHCPLEFPLRTSPV